MARKHSHSRPDLESLESRNLLSGNHFRGLILPNGQPINDADHARLAIHIKGAGLDPQNLSYGETTSSILPTLPQRRKFYRMPDGTQVSLTLYGVGTLKGSYQDSDGALNLRYDDTNAASRLIARVDHQRPGASGRVLLRSLIDADVPAESISGVGSNQIGIVNLPNFDLQPGGAVNLSGGVQVAQLGIIGPATTINIRSLPLPSSVSLPVSGVQVPSITYVTNSSGGTEIAGVGGLIVPGSITTSSSSTTGFTTRIAANGQIELVPTTTTSGSTTLVPGASLLVDAVQGTTGSTVLGPAQIFGYDPKTSLLLRFDTSTGQVLQQISVPATPAADGSAGVGLARVNGALVVLVGIDSTVYAYDGVTGAPVGSFSTANLTSGPAVVSGIAHSDNRTVLVSTASQKAQAIDVASSLASGQAVALGTPFSPSNGQFILSGDATGVAGVSTVAMPGSAYFTAYTPLNPNPQFGVLTASTKNETLSQTATTQVGTPSVSAPYASGSVATFPALVTAVKAATTDTPAHNVITTYDATKQTSNGTFNLYWPNQLTGLSESIHPELEGQALINIGGILTRMHAKDANGMVLNAIGYINTVEITRVTNSAIVAEPVGHLAIDQRDNLTVLSSDNRPTGTQNGVTIVPGLKPIGPLVPVRIPVR